MEYKEHPLASLFPPMEGAAFDEFVADIRTNGQRAPVTLCDGKVLDGRNRVKACSVIGVEPKFRNLNGEDPLAYVLSVNFHRRHLTESQRALIAAEAAGLSKGKRPQVADSNRSGNAPRGAFKPPLLKPSERKQLSQSQAAGMAGVSRRSVQRAAEVIREAPKKEIEKIRKGEKTVTEVERETKAAKTNGHVAKVEPPKPAARLDKTAYPIPESILEDWDRAEETARRMLSAVSSLRSELKNAKDDNDSIFAEVTNSTIADLNNAYTSFKCVVPYAVCTSCQGRAPKKCSLCRGRGFMSEFAWRSYVPAEAKAMREAVSKKK